MIPNTLPHLTLIRLAIWSLRVVAPASLLITFALLLGYRFLPPALEILAILEAAFYLLVSLPRQRKLNNSRPIAIHRGREERRALFEKCWESIPGPEGFVRTWFKGAPLEEIRREEIKDFLAWGFLYKTKAEKGDDEELEEYVWCMEKALGREFPAGRGVHRPSQVSTDPLRIQHKPLLFYNLAIGTDDLITYIKARRIGLQHHRLPWTQSLTVFPLRPYTVFSQHTSPSPRLSYYHRQHTSKTRLPLLFIHGIGAGLRTYTGFLRDFINTEPSGDGQTGVIAIELQAISMRITRGIPPRPELLSQIFKILDHHGWEKFVVAADSYGTIVATHLLQALHGTNRVGPMLLVNPVALSIHWGGIPYNFLYRRPRSASEWQLHYFASTDMGVAHSITRRFDWSENVLWKEDLRVREVTVALAGGDIILDAPALLEYLVRDSTLKTRVSNSKVLAPVVRGEGEMLDVMWYDGLNHAEMFDRAQDWAPLVKMLDTYCTVTG